MTTPRQELEEIEKKTFGVSEVFGEVMLGSLKLCERLVAENERMREALEDIAKDTADHPAFLGEKTTQRQMTKEGGDAASITWWNQLARAALTAPSGPDGKEVG